MNFDDVGDENAVHIQAVQYVTSTRIINSAHDIDGHIHTGVEYVLQLQ